MKAVVIYESLTGNTKVAGRLITDELIAAGIEAIDCPITQIDMQALSEADLVVVGSWTDGIIIAGQRPGRAARLQKMPRIDGKKTAVYCTYAINMGKTLEKMSTIMSRRGEDVIGGYAIHRKDLGGGAVEFVERLLGALDTTAA